MLASRLIAAAPETVDVFQPKTGGKPRRLSRAFPANNGAAVALPDLDPVAIEALPDDTVLLLDNQGVSYEPDSEGQLPVGFSRLVRYRFGQRLGEPVSIDVVTALLDPDQPVRLVGHDFVFVAEHPLADDPCRLAPDRLVIATDGGNQSLAFALSVQDEQLVMTPQREYLPMRLCGGRGLGVSGDRAFYDFGDDDGARWLPLVGQSRPRYAEQAILVTPVFDGREPDCVWHRLMLDARIPPEASVTVCSRTGHDRRSVENASWHAEPTLLLRPDGSEQPYARGPKTAPLAGEGTWELLFQQARGQFLQLRLVLRGDGRTTPRLRGSAGLLSAVFLSQHTTYRRSTARTCDRLRSWIGSWPTSRAPTRPWKTRSRRSRCCLTCAACLRMRSTGWRPGSRLRWIRGGTKRDGDFLLPTPWSFFRCVARCQGFALRSV